MRRAVDENGRSYRAIMSGGKEYRYYDDEPAYPGDVWDDISHLQQKDPQRTGYETQKPLKLLAVSYTHLAAEGQERKTQKLHKKRAKWQNSSFKIVYPAL